MSRGLAKQVPFTLALLVAWSATPGCLSKRERCAGVATCFGAQPAQCQNVPGCDPTPGCMLNPVTGDDCMTAATQADCASRAGCDWSNGTCLGACNLIGDQPTCDGTGGCIWSVCTGTPASCGTYTADSCPRSPLGCYVEPIE